MAEFGNVSSSTTLDRQYIITDQGIQKGSTAPTAVTIGTTPEIGASLYDAVAETGSAFLMLPFDMDKTVDPELIILVSLSSTQSNGEAVDITCDYVAVNSLVTANGIAKTSTQITGSTTFTTGNGLAIGDIYSVSLTIDANDATNDLVAASGIGVEFHLTNLTGVADIHILGACFKYKAKY